MVLNLFVYKGEEIERVNTHKNLGVVFDNKLCWNENTSSIIKKVNTRMHSLRKLRSFGVNTAVLATSVNKKMQ